MITNEIDNKNVLHGNKNVNELNKNLILFSITFVEATSVAFRLHKYTST